MKQCAYKGCTYDANSHGYCWRHQWCRTDEKYLEYKANKKSKPKKQKAIPKESKKRKVERKRYTEVCDELTAEIREKNGGRVYCFFSGVEITANRPHFHHLRSRTGDFYTDKEWLVPALDEYHVDGYHSKSVEYLLKQEWYTDVFLPNLREKSEELYNKELKRHEKAKSSFQEDDID